jgi:hypothetical protein
MGEERRYRRVPRGSVEAAFGTLDAEDPRQPSVGSEEGGRDGIQVALALAGRVRPPQVTDALDHGA